jgi:SPP1 family phage portal protein
MYKIPSDMPLTPERIVAYIDNNNNHKGRLEKLYRYYQGKNDILYRTNIDASKPNNRIAHNYGGFITDMYVGYFLGMPVTYNSEDKGFIEALQDIFNYNDEQSNNAEIGKEASIFGVGYELLYLDEDAQVRFIPLDTREIIPIYSDTITNDLLYVIRYYDVEDLVNYTYSTKVEVYTSTEIIYYDKIGGGGLIETNRVQHIFGEVPIVEYLNNKERLGDFETVICKIDEYDKLVSDSLNDFELFADAYMKLTNVEGTQREDLEQLKENRVILVPADGDAQWLVKETPYEHIEAMKTRCVEEIHKLSKCPNLTDINFASNASGVAMKYKLLGFEDNTAKKERHFEKGLRRRIKLITNVLNIKSNNFDFRSIDAVFTRNLPVNEVEQADYILRFRGLISDETILEQIPFIDDVQKELERKSNEAPKIQPFMISRPDNEEDNQLLEEAN